MRKRIIISDLDGTLLDAAAYSHAPAADALELVRRCDIPLILCSSKTRTEMEVLREELGNHHPFISENGGGIFVPRGYFNTFFKSVDAGDYQLLALGTPYAEIRRQFERLRDEMQVKVRGFGDMTAEEVVALTGLSLDAARRAMQRDFDEPFVFEGAPDRAFLQAIEAAGLNWTEGRLFHILGRHDKGRAVAMLRALYEHDAGKVETLGLGDSLNDLPLLQEADVPVLVRHDDGSHDARINVERLVKTQLPGPAGWNDAVRAWLGGASADALETMFCAALVAVDPYQAVLAATRIEKGSLWVGGERIDLDAFERILVVGAGKATARMAQAIETRLGTRIDAGLIVVKEGHALPLRIIELLEASHPVPDEAGVQAAARILEMVRTANERTLVICLLSGGASALLVAPAEGLTLQDKQQATSLLLGAGASIDELNAVRKHLSAIKGGRLAQAAPPAQVLGLLLSDVIGDRLDVIASGPTAADATSYRDALAVIDRYELAGKMPQRVMAHLEQGAQGKIAETVKPGDGCLERTRNVIVGANRLALEAAAAAARLLGIDAQIVDGALQGEASDAGRELAQRALRELEQVRDGERRCLLWGGETTVTVHGKGKGGRNQELALAFALAAAGLHGVTLLSAGTDGGDGPTDAAGACVNGQTTAQAHGLGIDAAEYLEQNDSYRFFRRYDERSGGHSHFITGPTGTNVMDIQMMLLERSSARETHS